MWGEADIRCDDSGADFSGRVCVDRKIANPGSEPERLAADVRAGVGSHSQASVLKSSKFYSEEGIVVIDSLWIAHLKIQSDDLGDRADDGPNLSQVDEVRGGKTPVEVGANGKKVVFYLFPRVIPGLNSREYFHNVK